MPKDYDSMEDSNRSSNPSIHQVSDPSRRVWLRGGMAAVAGAAFGPLVTGCATITPKAGEPLLGFKSVAVSTADAVIVPEGYVAQVIAAWGEPIGVPGNMPAWRGDASASAADQAVQMGMHHDGIHFYPLAGDGTRGLLAMNHEYTDDGLLHTDGLKAWSAEKVKKAQAAHGVSVTEVERRDGAWAMVRPSPYARRFTASDLLEATLARIDAFMKQESGLGILSKPGWSAYDEPVLLSSIEPNLRARIEGGDLLIYSKTNRSATVHRRARMELSGRPT